MKSARHMLLATLLVSLGCRSATPAVPVGPVGSVGPTGQKADPSTSDPTLPGALSEIQSVEVIAEEGRYVFSADGRKQYTYKIAYRILNASALSEWSTISADWTPWYQAPPKLSAVVTTAQGKKFTLDKKSIAEVPAGTNDALLFSDRRRLVAPLPGLEVGALVEQVTVYDDVRPFFAEGAVGRFYFGMRVPVFQSRLILDAPENIPLQWAVRGVNIDPDQTVESGRRIVTFQTGPVLPQGRFDALLPPELPRYPYVAFSTARNWQGVAARYAALVEGQLLGANVSSLVDGVGNNTNGTQEVATELMRRIHQQVRYTGIEFGRQAIVPWTPKQTLERGYGDCKDKGTLLVAMLRELGIEASLAILKVGFGEDALPALPGLESFNHAIVYVPGPHPLWIDATADLTPVGDIPSAVQGRLALIASPSTTELVRIPEANVDYARYVEVREVQMAPWGAGTVRETTSGRGAMQDKLRAQYSGAPKARIGDALERYVKSTYKAEGISDFTMTDPRDLRVPFRISIRADDAAVSYTSARDAHVQLRTAVLFSWLPESLRLAALAGPDERDDERRVAAERIAERTEDVMFPEPYTAELRYEIQWPSGFELVKRPKNEVKTFGPATFEERYDVEAERLVATFTIATNKRRYSAVEARQFVLGLYTIFDGAIPRIDFIHRGARLLADGQTREALAVYRRIVENEPDNAFHRARFADVLLEVGLGAPAREQIRIALEQQPDSARVQYVAAVVFSHDVFGRRFKPGFDRKAAIAAYRRVLALEPEHQEARFSLAVLLEHDDDGVRYRNKEGVAQAVELYRTLSSIEGRPNHENNLLIALFESRDYDGLEEAAELASPSPVKSALLMVAVAVTEGIDAAFERVDELRLSPDTKQKVYEDATTSLTHARRYDLAREVVRRAALSSPDPLGLQKQIVRLSKLERHDAPTGAPKTPIAVVEQALAAMFASTLDLEKIEAMFVRVGSGEAAKDEARRLTGGYSAFQKASRTSGVPLDAMRDNVLSLTKFHVEGDDTIGYRIGGTSLGGKPGEVTWWFVVKDGGRYRLRATEVSIASLGEEALHLLLQKKNRRAAHKWLNWAKEIVPYRSGADPLAEHPFLALWSGGTGSIRLSAAALQATGPRGEKIIGLLERERKKNKAPEVRMHIDHALLLALVGTKHTDKMVEVSTRLYRQLESSETAFSMYCGALVAAGREKEIIDLLSKRLDRHPRDAFARSSLADLLTKNGDNQRAEQVMRGGIRIGIASPTMYNNLAWLRLFASDVGEADVELALEANAMTSFENLSHLHTLAALYAEIGKTREALQLVRRRMELSGRDTPNGPDWYLLGRIMQDYGLIDLAREAYGRVQINEDRPTDSTWALARMKLRSLAKLSPGKRI